jgi:hypothetical protein
VAAVRAGPQFRPALLWLLLAAGLLFFFGHATSGDSQRQKGYRATDAPLVTSRLQNRQVGRVDAIIGRLPRARSSGQARTPLTAAGVAAQSRLRAHARQQKQYGLAVVRLEATTGLDECDTSFLPTTREWRTLRHCTDAPRRAKKSTGSFSDARMWRGRVELGDAHR